MTLASLRHRQLQGKPNKVTGVWKIRSGNQGNDFTYIARFKFKFDTYTVKGPHSGTYVPGTQWVAPSDLVVGGTRDLPIP